MLSRFSTRCRARRDQSGYAMVMALFLIVAMIASSEVVLQNLVTLRRRQRESDAIWRGRQYQRAIRLYYHKTGHYPQSLDELQKGMPELHFLRFCAYKDPMNTADGSWRFIYVNGTGQIIGSVRYASLQQMALIDLNLGKLPAVQPGAQVGTPAADLASSSSPGDANAAANSSPLPPQPGGAAAAQPSQSSPSSPAAPAPGAPSGAAGGPSAGTGPNGAFDQAPVTNPVLLQKPTGPVDGPVLGAFITGVASKVDRPSIKVYNGGKKYIDWEFIWNPLEEQARALQNGLSPQGSQQPGQFGLPISPVNGPAPGQPAGGPGAAPPQTPPPAPNPN
jgi:hypothetical protein